MRKKASNLTKTWNTNLEPGATLEGLYMAKEIVNDNYEDKEREKYVIKDPSGDLYGVFGSASLKRQFQSIPVGSYVWIEYKGEEVSKNGRTVKIYDVEYDDEYQQ